MQFGKEYLVSVEFTLPTDTNAGSLYFQNLSEDFTVGKLVTYLGLPVLSHVPVLGSILDITIKTATLGLETGESGELSLYGFKSEMYVGSADMKIFQLSEVNTVVAYNKSLSGAAEVSFSLSGFVNKKAFIETRYDPKTSEFSGELLVTTNSSLSIDECVGLFINQKDLSQNSAYATVSNDTSVSTFFNLKYLSDQKDVVVQQFSISILSALSFGPMTLTRLQLLYKNSDGGTKHPTKNHSTLLPVGSNLHLLAVMQQKNRNFGLQLSFDCSIKSPGSKVLTATIQLSPQKSLTLRSFLSLFGLKPPELPDSEASSKPQTSGFLDLQLIKGSLTFATAPFKIITFEVTTGIASAGWALLNNPDVSLSDIYLTVAYPEKDGISAKLLGSVTVGDLTMQVVGTKTEQVSKFHLVVSHNQSTDNDLMGVVHSLSQESRSDTTIPTDAGLPAHLKGSLAAFEVEISPQVISLSLQLDVSLPEWSIDLGFSQFSAKNLTLALSWKRESTEKKQSAQPVSHLKKYLLNLSAKLQFGNIPALLEMDIGSQTYTILQASINPKNIDLGVIVDKTLDFASSKPPKAGSKSKKGESFSDLLPTGTVPFHFTTGFLQLNLTQDLCLVFGRVKDLGSCLLVAGKLEKSSGFGYAVVLSLSSFSSLLPPLADIKDVLTVKDVNASILNLDGMNVDSLVKTIHTAQEHVGELQVPPFANLPLEPKEEIGEQGIVRGTSLYAVLGFKTQSALLSNLVSIQQSKKMPGDIILYAHVTQDPTDSIFLAHIPSLTLFGLLNFTDI